MIFDKDNLPYFIPNRNKYNLTKKSIETLYKKDFTIYTSVRPNWEEMEINSQQGIVVKNGMHGGIFAGKEQDDNEIFFKFSIWLENIKTETKYSKDIIAKVDKKENFYNVSITHCSKNKTFILYVDENHYKETYTDQIIDYSNSWIWVGAACNFPNFSQEHRNFFIGEISSIALFKRKLQKKEIISIFNNKNKIDIAKDYNPVVFTDFSVKTPYKVKDLTNNGHNLNLSNYDFM